MSRDRNAPYWVHSDPTSREALERVMPPCVRRCVRARKHGTDCAEKDCRGCEPRPAEFGLLCYVCHQRLLNMLHTAPAQHALLLAVIAPSYEQQLSQETTAHMPGPRTNSSGPQYIGMATRGFAAEGGEPIRVATTDTARQMTDILSEWVEMLVQQHQMSGPNRLATKAQAEDGRHGHWRESRWPLYIDPETGLDEDPEWVWSDPPATFAIGSASRWLIAQAERLENCPGIGDLWTELAEVMSQAHALAPWREQAATLRGIECPECHRSTLRLFGGDEDVTCTTCHAIIGWDRYAIWVRELQQRRVS